MTLDVGLESLDKRTGPLDQKLVVSLEAGELGFLIDVVQKIYLFTGTVLDLYEDARLQGPQLLLFERLINEALIDAESNPISWNQFTGFLFQPGNRKEQTLIFRDEVITKLNSLIFLTRQAHESNRSLFFFGD
ncbi:MAG: hypothetical protein KDA70_03195 [Planctomycetaceae bacterium]|nr:hypothetical protein [Planctomycetaceae bacterium]